MRQVSAYSCVETTSIIQSPHHCVAHRTQREQSSAIERASAQNIANADIEALTEEEAYKLFSDFRWSSNGGRPTCPACGHDKVYTVRRRSLRCARPGCRKEFTSTTATLFASRKLSFKRIVLAIREQAQADSRLVARRLGFKIDVSYKTAHGLRKRLEQVAAEGIGECKARRRASK
jgi:transposase-like protein